MSSLKRPGFIRRKARTAIRIDILRREVLSQSVRYVCSPKHKRGQFESETGEPELGKLEPTASVCPGDLNFNVKTSTKWLKAGLRRGYTGAPLVSDGFPQYIWYMVEGRWFEATYSRNGRYHGYPVDDPSTLPDELVNE